MRQLTEKDFIDYKDTILKGRLRISGMRSYLFGLLAFSGIAVGVSYSVANANTIGWNNLSAGWHTIFFIEAVLFAIHALILLLCWANNSFNQKILSLAVVLLTYKTAFDPFLAMSMFFKDRGVFDSYMPFTLLIIGIGLIIHVIVLIKWIKDLSPKKERNKDTNSKDKKKTKIKVWLPVLLVLVALSSIIVKNNLLGDFELMYGLFIFTVLYIALLIGVCEFIIAAYCIFRFPSFSVNPPPKQLYVKGKKRKRKRKR
ncbi:hypothetical protein B5V88_16370 [Heyndrickxia sporothermodurans]|uniref:hypothetical protein n=1 Tax=Heyndrickxia sporothermodurans TaxID=46224 RepID=UPI000D39796B|nr:hypothetical protein [Heyndrickxia sporothermodurans]PTY74065.1 hypothetical protein B5V88_16370 [Heyndrickxia sporothermodurans]